MRKAISSAVIFLLFSISLFSRSPEVDDISFYFEKQHIFVGFSLKENFLNQDIVDAINSTKEITFRYEIELVRKKFLWLDKTILKSVIEKKIQYDNMTRQFEVKVLLNDELVDKKSLTSLEDVITELSKVGPIDLGQTADLSPGENLYYLRARATLFKEFFLLIFPNDVDTGWKEKTLKTP
ncbi:MAG: DUF4390 domain-containing protein [Acidobacteria bacterium]|nr:DUF4390 domain-containing protein [Acidobacteriota bacterium]